MKKILLIILLFMFTIPAYSAPPSRTSSYVSGTTIVASDVTGNEDAIFNYLQAGVDTYSPLSITNADISGSASISDTKLDLATIEQNIQFNGTSTFAGASTFSSDVTFASQTIADLGTVTTATFTAITDLGTVTTAAFTAITNLGNVTTTGTIGLGGKLTAGANEIEGSAFDIDGGDISASTISGGLTWSAAQDLDSQDLTNVDINSGTLDGVQIGGTEATGEIFINDASDAADGLGSQGDAGQVLTSAGTGANPTWANTDWLLVQTKSTSGATNSGDITIAASKQYYVTYRIEADTGAADADVGIRVHNDEGGSSYAWGGHAVVYNTTTVSTTDGDSSDDAIYLTKGTGGYVISMGSDGDNGIIYGFLYLDTYKQAETVIANIAGEFNYIDGAAASGHATFGGRMINNATITSFEFFSTANADYEIKVYELSQS